jgi:hypothetical protein
MDAQVPAQQVILTRLLPSRGVVGGQLIMTVADGAVVSAAEPRSIGIDGCHLCGTDGIAKQREAATLVVLSELWIRMVEDP